MRVDPGPSVIHKKTADSSPAKHVLVNIARVVNNFPRLTSAVEEAQESINPGVFPNRTGKERERAEGPVPEDNPNLYIYAAHHLRNEQRGSKIQFVSAAFPPAAIIEGICH